jgi:hypothetical protein
MQKDSTLTFWDDYYQKLDENGAEIISDEPKEWIIRPTEELLRQIGSFLPEWKDASDSDSSSSCLRILEIGCGISSLAMQLWRYLQLREEEHQRKNGKRRRKRIDAWATDVSQVCIRQVQRRDALLLAKQSHEEGVFQYSALNVTEPHPELMGKFDMILDKGCLDTFLFRSRCRGGGNRPYSQLVQTVLDHVQSWLRGPSSIYLILSPRSKLMVVRDYNGFVSVERFDLAHTMVSEDLETMGGSRQHCEQTRKVKQRCVNLYVCHKNPDYRPGAAFSLETKPVHDEDFCTSCGVTFFDFRKGEGLSYRGEAFWFRQWRGHCKHCKT